MSATILDTLCRERAETTARWVLAEIVRFVRDRQPEQTETLAHHLPYWGAALRDMLDDLSGQLSGMPKAELIERSLMMLRTHADLGLVQAVLIPAGAEIEAATAEREPLRPLLGQIEVRDLEVDWRGRGVHRPGLLRRGSS